MRITSLLMILLCLLQQQQAFARQGAGATLSFTTIEAESMRTNAVVPDPRVEPHFVETESSGRQAVRLDKREHFLAFTASASTNTMVIRFSLPDHPQGGGISSSLLIFVNGILAKDCRIHSYNTWLYGKYPFSNDPAMGRPRHFYDEYRITDLELRNGDEVQLKNGNDSIACVVDLVDLEQAPPAISAPANAIVLTDPVYRAYSKGNDYTEVLRRCIGKAVETGQEIYMPAGEFIISGDIILPSNIVIKGAGIWYTVLKGDATVYDQPGRRVRLRGKGSSITLNDFSIDGALRYRNDKEDNDGIVGSFGEHSEIKNIWIEHTKVGIWVENSSGLDVKGCRMRNTIADGLNFCVGMYSSVVRNCSTRGTGDDGFAIWPAVFGKQVYSPGHNQIIECTAQLPWLANGAAVYGGESNSISNCLFTDITQGSGILISTTFPTESNKGIDNNFSGITRVNNCTITGSGGFDHEWDWRGAVEICTDKRVINGLEISNVRIENSLSSAVRVVAKPGGSLQHCELKNVMGVGVRSLNGLMITAGAQGALTLKQCSFPEMKQVSRALTIKEE